MKRGKIIVLTPYYPPIKGGVSSYVSNLVSKLDYFNFDTKVITRNGNNGKNTYVVNQKAYFVIKSILILYRYKPNIIHAHSNWYTLTPSVIYKLLNPKTRLIFTFHTEPIDKIKSLKKRIYQLLLSRCDVVTFVSIALKNKLEENFRMNTNTRVIYAGVTANKVDKNEIRQFTDEYLLENSRPIISFVGPLVLKQKVEGIKILIRAFKIVKERYPDAKLLIIGDGKYKVELEQLCKKIEIYDIVFTGFLDNVFVPLELTDIYTHITLQEGFPISLLEAMSIGKPVIATIVGGVPEIIVNYENGILTEADPEIIGRNIISLYEDKIKMKIIGEKARTTIEKRYDWESITKEYINIYI